jgi:hypothetical protein
MASPSVLMALVALIIGYVIKQRRWRAKLPPGPPRLPLIGNLHQAPTTAAWVVFKKWVEQYGPLVSADFGGTNVIIIGDYDTARDLLDKRGNIYSSRPRMVVWHREIGRDIKADKYRSWHKS